MSGMLIKRKQKRYTARKTTGAAFLVFVFSIAALFTRCPYNLNIYSFKKNDFSFFFL